MNKLLPAAVAAMSLGAYAAETNETATAELPPVVVEASRIGKTPKEIPAAVQVITRGEIAASGAKDVVDLLQKKAATIDFAHLGGNNPALAQIAPRGYGENGFGRMLVVVDGERLNSPDMNAPNLAQIGLGAIERIEILQGSQNVLHGDVGSAGMINIITDPNDYEKRVASRRRQGLGNAVLGQRRLGPFRRLPPRQRLRLLLRRRRREAELRQRLLCAPLRVLVRRRQRPPRLPLARRLEAPPDPFRRLQRLLPPHDVRA